MSGGEARPVLGRRMYLGDSGESGHGVPGGARRLLLKDAGGCGAQREGAQGRLVF